MAFQSELPSRYEIRVLEPKHVAWAGAIVMHSNMFHSPIWPLLYPEGLTKRLYACFSAGDYLIRHQVESGLSLGVFDKEYQYKSPESAAVGGKLYWDASDESADSIKLLEQMDFPLVSVALAYDNFNHLDMEKMKPLIAMLPEFGQIYGILAQRDKRDPQIWEAKGLGEVISRNATSTRRDYEGKGIMKNLAHCMIRDMASKGWRGIQIECFNDAVTHVWTNPPTPHRSEEISDVHTWTYEEENEKGDLLRPFRPASQRIVKVYCHLTE
ncbi:hypothetical protein QQS21_005053 [Conoideocrella luteorostrata]|uniref:Uncharacterized protein n=1 Tax=Conoideocrella luteorostrata TaxID=1105319 RepID=A0AAJ0FZB9_9HYPO|nr:hypothetical protein QQS21_005053 [Conoideocrella luteorostrata]